MSTPAANDAIFVAGRLIANVTDLTAASPYGGTELGLVGNVDVIRPPKFFRIRKPENNSADGIIWLGGDLELDVGLKSWDPDGVELLFRGGSQSGGVPAWTAQASGIGAQVTPIGNVAWVPVNSGRPHTVLHDVVAVPLNDIPTRFSAYRFMEFRIKLIALDVTDGLGGIGDTSVAL